MSDDRVLYASPLLQVASFRCPAHDTRWVTTNVIDSPAPLVAFPQLLTPNPQVIGNVEFRRALLHAIDRQEMANTFQPGLAVVAHAVISPDSASIRRWRERLRGTSTIRVAPRK